MSLGRVCTVFGDPALKGKDGIYFTPIKGHSPIVRCPGSLFEITHASVIGSYPVSGDVEVENLVHILHHHHICIEQNYFLETLLTTIRKF